MVLSEEDVVGENKYFFMYRPTRHKRFKFVARPARDSAPQGGTTDTNDGINKKKLYHLDEKGIVSVRARATAL
ncbi:hypothetical protein EVAR_100844_1 [Eumeta japonica]|uniref:Uncharacterized protein n=1 Tax=Eumeta variegata TaxID=151549 RepID=A0A4C2A8M1_EUMVA|nr:hypothetical protein EVAR_100844_1 [Eumeta japonica]